MKIPWKTWSSYIKDLRKVNDEAGRLVLDYMATHEIYTPDQVDDLIRYCYAISTRYGEAASTLAARMYDSIAEAAGVAVESALPAATATYGDVASAVLGARKQSGGDELVASAVSRQVKLAGVDTTMQNAIRDGAEWAWIPVGETCAFCITLASNGWQPASKKALKGGHAEHIHANCDCTYAIRFDSTSNVAGYNPRKYERIYYGAEGSSSKDKINSIRRDLYKHAAEDGDAEAKA